MPVHVMLQFFKWLSVLHKALLFENVSIFLCRVNVGEQHLSVAAVLPPGYLAYEPLGLGKGVSLQSALYFNL